MRWFEGSIPSAIAETKAQRKLLVVYVHDGSEESVKMSAVLDDAAVAERLEPEKIVALELESQTEGFRQFSAFYPVLLLPSVYFVGDNGVPLEVVGGFQPVEDFLAKIDNAWRLHWPETTGDSSEAAGAVDAAVASAAPAAQSSQTNAAPQTEATLQAASRSETTPSEAPPEIPLGDRLQTARENIEEQNRERLKKEAGEARRREIERRKLGQEMAESSRAKEEEAVKKRAEEIAKEKEADKRAKERIKEQIQRDRDERRAKFDEEKKSKERDRERVKEEKQKKKEAEEAAASAELQSRIRSVSRIQFRLPDGGAINREFSVDAPFSEARSFIEEILVSRGMSRFDLVHSLTRRAFQSSDAESTMAELDLAGPNALIVVPSRGPAPSPSGSGGGGGRGGGFSLVAIFWVVMAPFLFLYNVVRDTFVGPAIADGNAGGSQPGSAPPPHSDSQGKSTGGGGGGGGPRQRSNVDGNVHRLRRYSDSDSEDKTWNGNSTQQM